MYYSLYSFYVVVIVQCLAMRKQERVDSTGAVALSYGCFILRFCTFRSRVFLRIAYFPKKKAVALIKRNSKYVTFTVFENVSE